VGSFLLQQDRMFFGKFSGRGVLSNWEIIGDFGGQKII
jgi:hypothetical protein